MFAIRQPVRCSRALAALVSVLLSGYFGPAGAAECENYDDWSAELGSLARNTWVSQVAVVRSFAYVSNFELEIEVIDFSDSSTPRQLGALPYAGRCGGVCAHDSYVYLAFDDSLAVLDATEGGAPRVLSTVSLGARRASGLNTDGRRLWFGQADSLHLYDLEDPVHPRYRSSIAGGSPGWPPIVADTLAFVIDSPSRVQIYSVADMDRPVRLGKLPRYAGIGGLAFRNGILYTHAFDRWVQAFDIRDPAKPTEVGAYLWRGLDDPEDQTYDLQVFGDTMYVSTASEIAAVDVSDPLHPELVGVREGPLGALAVNGELGIHVTDEQLRVFDRSSFQAVLPRSTQWSGDSPVAAVTVGNLIYEAGGWGTDLAVPGGLRIFEATPSGLRTMGKLEVAPVPWEFPGFDDVVVRGSLAYVVYAGDVWVIDVEDPRAPRQLSVVETPRRTLRLASNGQILVCTTRDGSADVFQVLPDGSLDSLATWNFPGGTESLLLSGSRAFVGGREGGVLIASVLDPKLPRVVARVTGTSRTTALALEGNTLFVLERDGILRAIEDVDSASPTEAGRLVDPRMRGSSMVATASTVWIGRSGTDRMAVVDASDPGHMRVVSRTLAYGFARPIAVAPTGIVVGVESIVSWGGGGITIFPFRCNEAVPDRLCELRARFVRTSVELSWRVASGSLSEFTVLRKLSSDLSPTWTTLNPRAPDSPDGAWTCLDPTVKPSTSYLYSVRGRREDGLWIDFGPIAVSTSSFEPITLSIGPNPIAIGGRITFRLPESGVATLDLFDVSGRRVRRLLDGWHREGEHELMWPEAERSTRRVGPGVYWIRLATANERLTRRVLLIR